MGGSVQRWRHYQGGGFAPCTRSCAPSSAPSDFSAEKIALGVVVGASSRPGGDSLFRCALTVFPLVDEVYPAGGRRPNVVFCPLVVSPSSPALSNCSVDLRLRGSSRPRLADSPTSPACPPPTPTCHLPPAVIYLPPPPATSLPCPPILCVWLAWCRLGAYSSRRTSIMAAMPPPARRYVALATGVGL